MTESFAGLWMFYLEESRAGEAMHIPGTEGYRCHSQSTRRGCKGVVQKWGT